MAAQIQNKEVDAKNTQADKKLEAEIDATLELLQPLQSRKDPRTM